MINWAQFLTPAVQQRNDLAPFVGNMIDEDAKAKRQATVDAEGLRRNTFQEGRETSRDTESLRHNQAEEGFQQKNLDLHSAEEQRRVREGLMNEWYVARDSGNPEALDAVHEKMRAHGFVIDDGAAPPRPERGSSISPPALGGTDFAPSAPRTPDAPRDIGRGKAAGMDQEKPREYSGSAVPGDMAMGRGGMSAPAAEAQRIHKDQETNMPEDTLANRRFRVKDSKGIALGEYDEGKGRASRESEVSAAFDSLASGVNTKEEKAAADAGRKTAMDMVKTGTAKAAIERGTTVFKEMMAPYRKVRTDAAAAGGGGDPKLEQNRLIAANNEERGWEGTIRGDEDLKKTLTGEQQLKNSMALLDQASGMGDKIAAAKLIKEHFGAAASEGERAYILGAAGTWERYKGILNQWETGPDAGRFSPTFVTQLRQILAAGIQRAEANKQEASRKYELALQNTHGVLRPKEREEAANFAHEYVTGEKRTPATNSPPGHIDAEMDEILRKAGRKK